MPESHAYLILYLEVLDKISSARIQLETRAMEKGTLSLLYRSGASVELLN
jgi:hypothetical protein